MRDKILLADDARFVRMMMREILARFGHTNILEAKNGLEAVTIYKQNFPALTILDITMPELDGLSALKEIISFDPAAKIIMCSAISHSGIIREALDLGALAFIEKPFQAEEFGNSITAYLGSH